MEELKREQNPNTLHVEVMKRDDDGCALVAYLVITNQPSTHGMNGGRIIQMNIDSFHADGNHAIVAMYRRQWDLQPQHPTVKDFVNELNAKYNL